MNANAYHGIIERRASKLVNPYDLAKPENLCVKKQEPRLMFLVPAIIYNNQDVFAYEFAFQGFVFFILRQIRVK